MAVITVDLPVRRGAYRATEREAARRRDATRYERLDREKTLAADLDLALYRMRDAERKIRLYRDALIPKAEQSLNVARQEFESGKATFFTLIDAERALLEFQLAYHRARADRAVYRAEAETLSGTY